MSTVGITIAVIPTIFFINTIDSDRVITASLEATIEWDIFKRD